MKSQSKYSIGENEIKTNQPEKKNMIQSKEKCLFELH